VERNSVETDIIPTTWWEAGAGLNGVLGEEFSYSAYLHSGLMTGSNSSYAVRSGRQKVAEAAASDPAATIALSWGIPGAEIGGALQYQSDITQGADAEAGSALLGEVHVEVSRGTLGLRALYAEWALEGNGPESFGADRQFGWYVEPSIRIVGSAGVFCRYSQWDNRAGSSEDSEKVQYDLGVNFWPHDHVIVKVDHQWQESESRKDQNGVNIGIGYDF
jgi:hypothetical protein